MRALSSSVVLALLGFSTVVGLAGCGSSTPPPETAGGAGAAPTVAKPTAKPEDDAAKRAAALETLTQEEAKSGNCDPEHKAALEKLLGDVEAALKTKTGEDGAPLNLQIVGKRVVALGPNARSVEMSVTGKGTELHVLAFGAKDISMDVLVGQLAATTMRSPYARPTTLALDVPKVGHVDELAVDSRQVTIRPGAPIVVRLTGQGCAATISALKP